ncbi:hypothetical protein C8Q73DRAFT_766452 [Cubamyces lactineus]|nr:hypothetical protein C8Q73DRAFT_766452 [Cubamyces lactineus]
MTGEITPSTTTPLGIVSELPDPLAGNASQHNDAGRQQDRTSDIANAGAIPEPTIFAPPHEDIPAALRIIRAIENVWRLPEIGDCPTIDAEQDKRMRLSQPYEVRRRVHEEEAFEEHDSRGNFTPENIKRRKHNAELVEQLTKIGAEFRNYASGHLDAPFTLRITRAGCEFDGSIAPSVPKSRYDVDEAVKSRLQKWFDNAAVSGYGDVQEQVTKVDEEVRAAREITSTGFQVEPELLRRVEQLWCGHFVPGSNVRAEPYKIHLYGPDGHFRSHRDTPQHGLVGTFLLGLGDTALDGGLVIEDEEMGADPGQWCAFYPDVPHEVKSLYNGYRATIAFKIFRELSSTGETTKTREVRAQVLEIIKKLEASYAILLEHKYGLSTEQFNGFDAIVADCVRSLATVRTYHLPVVIESRSFWGSSSRGDPSEDWHMACSTTVYPFARGYIDALTDTQSSRLSDGASHARCGCPWLDGVEGLPFFSLDLSRAAISIRNEERETCNYVGNEAQEWEEESVYLSHALIALPALAATRDADKE